MEATTSTGPLATVQRFAGFIIEGNLDEACALLTDDFVALEAAGLPYSGTYHGADGFRELLGRLTEELDMAPLTYELLDAGHVIVNYAVLRFTARATGKSVEISVAELFTVRDGKISKLDVYYKDAAAVTALIR